MERVNGLVLLPFLKVFKELGKMQSKDGINHGNIGSPKIRKVNITINIGEIDIRREKINQL